MGNGTDHLENLQPDLEWDFDTFKDLIPAASLTSQGIRQAVLEASLHKEQRISSVEVVPQEDEENHEAEEAED